MVVMLHEQHDDDRGDANQQRQPVRLGQVNQEVIEALPHITFAGFDPEDLRQLLDCNDNRQA